MKKHVKKIWTITIMILLIMAIVACGNGSSETTQPKTDGTTPTVTNPEASKPSGHDAVYRIGISTQSWKHEFLKNMVNALQVIDERMENVELLTVDSEDSVEKQLNDIDNLIAQEVDGIILNALSFEGSGPAVDAANAANIPIIELVSYTENDNFLTFVGTDVKSSGRIAGELAAEMLEGRGRVFELQGIVGHTAQINRGAGIAEALQGFDGMEIVESQSGEFTKDKAMEVTEAWLAKYQKGDIDIIIAHNDAMALGAMNACIGANRTEIKIIGIDGDAEALQSIIDGTLSATVLDYVELESEKAIEEMVSILEGNNPQGRIIVEYVPITTADKAKEFLDLRS